MYALFPRYSILILLMLVLVMFLSSCGRKGPLEPIEDTGYPHQYPAQNPDCMD